MDTENYLKMKFSESAKKGNKLSYQLKSEKLSNEVNIFSQ